jgi:acyl carrier protein
MSTIFETIREILHKHYSINFNQIRPETKFEQELGIDSREFLELIVDLEFAFNVEINLDDAVEVVTIQDAIGYIETKILAQD